MDPEIEKMCEIKTETDKLYFFEECEGFRKGSSLLYIPETQQLYRFKSNTKTAKRYICYHKECAKGVVVDFPDSNICRMPLARGGDVHNHPTQETTYQKMKLANAIKKRCADSTLRKSELRKIFNEECSKNETESIDIQFDRMRRHLINIRNSAFPKCPKNSTDVSEIFKNQNVLESYGMSRYKKTDKFYQGTIIEEQFSYTIFMSPTIAEEIKKLPTTNPRNYVIDAAFEAVPPCGYKQLLIIYFCYEEQVYPLIYTLMSSKDEECYRHVFKFIDSNLFKLEADSFATDSENNLRNGLKAVFPSVTLNTCWFHFCQAVRRRVNEIALLRNKLNSSAQATRIFKKLLALPLLKSTNIVSEFELLKVEANQLEAFSEFDELFRYFQNEWMREDETPLTCSVHKNEMKTTRALESLNSQLSRKLTKSEHFFKFIDCLLDQDLAKSKDFDMSLNGTLDVFQPPTKRHKDNSFPAGDMTDNSDRNNTTINDFFKQITNSKNETLIIENSRFFNIKSEDDVNAYNSNSENNEGNANNPEPLILCTKCCENPRAVLLQPCNHFNLCSMCFEEIAEDHIKYGYPILCPICGQIVKNSTVILF